MSNIGRPVDVLLGDAETPEEYRRTYRAVVQLLEVAFYAGWRGAAREETSLRVAACADFVRGAVGDWKPPT